MTVILAQSYLSSTRSVLDEARRVQDLLDRDPAAAQVAVDDLAEAAAHQDAGGDSYFAFMFSEQQTAAVEGATEETTEQLLAGAVAELQVANVLMAAGQATGDAGVNGQPQLLAQAVEELEGTVEAFDRAGTPQTGRLGFSSPSAASAKSPTGVFAEEAFRRTADDLLTLVVTSSSEVISSMLEKLRKLVPENVTEAMGKLGKEVETLPKVGRVLRLGLSKLEKVLNLLSRLVGKDVAAGLKDWMQELWNKVRSGNLVLAVLEAVLDIDSARACVDTALRSESLDRAKVDRAVEELALLEARFQDAVKTVKVLAQSVGLALAVAGVIAIFVAQLAAMLGAVSALIYLLIIGGVVLLGMDYVDTRLDLRRVDGVRTIATRLWA